MTKKLKKMKNAQNILFLPIMIFFMGMLFWQNERNQKQNRELVYELVNSFKKEAPQISEGLPPEEELNQEMLSRIPEVQASTLDPNDKMFDVLKNLADHFSQYNVNKRQNITNVDINGDGLIDFLFHRYNYSAHSRDYSYILEVHTNNGNGFDNAYRCTYSRSNNHDYYYGDCAG